MKEKHRKTGYSIVTAQAWRRTGSEDTLKILINYEKGDYNKMTTLYFKAYFPLGILGTSSNNPDLYREFIGSKAPDAMTVEEEVEAIGIESVTEKGITVFPRDEDGNPFIYDYQIKGFFKDASKMKKKEKGSISSTIKAYRQDIDGLIFPNPRKIPIHYAGDITILQRPLRASTAQGERIALAASEYIGEGAWIEFEVTTLVDDYADWIRELMAYGQYRGLGQWRNSGIGKFTYEEVGCQK